MRFRRPKLLEVVVALLTGGLVGGGAVLTGWTQARDWDVRAKTWALLRAVEDSKEMGLSLGLDIEELRRRLRPWVDSPEA